MRIRRKALQMAFLMALTSPSLSWAQQQEDLNFITVNPEVVGASSDLYQEIANEFNLEYENIGRREAERVLTNNRLSITGGLNSIGFTYKRPFVNFGVSLDRNLAPDLFDDTRWIVTDSLTIDIDASKLLGNLRDQKVIDMTETNYGAFVGVVFKRKFTWVHYANSYEEGLSTHFEKLFMPFSALSLSNVKKIGPNEIILKEDSISLKGGGMVSAPLYPGLTGMAGVLAKFEKISSVEVVSFPETQSILISSEKQKVGSVGVSLALQADFIRILRMTLLSYDLNYSWESSYKIYLNMPQSELMSKETSDPVGEELDKILKNKTAKIEVLAPYLVSEEKRVAQKISHKYNFLLFGGMKNSKTQQIEVGKEGHLKTIFRHYYEKIRYTEDLVSKLFASFLYAITNTDISAVMMASDTKNVTIEYDSDKNLMESRSDLYVGESAPAEQKISLTFASTFFTNKTKGVIGKKFRDRAVYLLQHFSGVDPLAITLIEGEALKAPFQIEGKYQVGMEGVRFLHSQSVGAVFDHLDKLCREYPKNKWFNLRNLFDGCRRSLENDYIDYFKDLTHNKVADDDIKKCEKKAKKFFFSPGKKRAFIKNCLSDINRLPEEQWVNIPLWPLKNFANNVVSKAYDKEDFYRLFGTPNVFFFGSFDARTLDGFDFTTHFHAGDFRGLGVVDNYLRAENLRAPASVVIDQ